jgi:hypothetical protein
MHNRGIQGKAMKDDPMSEYETVIFERTQRNAYVNNNGSAKASGLASCSYLFILHVTAS